MGRTTGDRRRGGVRGDTATASPDDAAAVPPPEDTAGQQPPGDPEEVARIVCLRMLDRRARSRAELAGALAEKGVPEDSADRVLDRFVEVGLIDDEALAHTLAGAQHRERGLARRAVAHKLRQRGFDDEVVSDALTEIDDGDERRRAADLVARKHRALGGLPVEVRTRRLVGLLGRKGYSAGLAWEVVRAELAVAATEDDAESYG